VPRIQQEWLDSIVYLYETKEQANAGLRAGATGFIVSVGREDPDLPEVFGHHYIVTNRHCVEPRRDLVARINLHGSGFDVLELPFEAWKPHPDNDDVTVATLDFKTKYYQYASVNRGMMLSRELLAAWDFGPGDEAFFIGRYVDLDGKTYNVPTVRSGIVSAFPMEPIIQPERGHAQESILVEARSLTGYSGSPVFVIQSATIEKSDDGGIESYPRVKSRDGSPVFLLGIDWGHHQWLENLRDEHGNRLPQKIPTNSGMMKVVPAWKLLDILDGSREFVEERRKREARAKTELAEGSVVQDSAREGDNSPKSDGE
jgi:hypothetical protein